MANYDRDGEKFVGMLKFCFAMLFLLVILAWIWTANRAAPTASKTAPSVVAPTTTAPVATKPVAPVAQ